MSTSSWQQIPAATLADRVYHAVRARIVAGDVVPGEFIREASLNAALGVSRTPVREALGRLASEGFLERMPRRGFRVPVEPIASLLELYPVIAALDLLAGRLALPRLTAADVAELKRINDELRAAMARRDVQALVERNNEFHHLFGERSGNRQLCALLDDLRPKLTRLERWYYSSGGDSARSIEEHAQIIAAIERGDHARALALLETNMALTHERLARETREQAAAD